jgi:flagellar L-ring protein precursor FlgH
MRTVIALIGVGLLAGPAAGQSLFLAEPPPPPVGDEVLDPAAPVYQFSLIAVAPPRPKSFKVHDLITIVIDESSRQQAEQSLKSDKKYDLDARIGPILDFLEALELRLKAGDSADVPLVGAGYTNKFNGQGEYERTDRFTAKITAEIIDVKPNGTLVLEARKRISKDEEVQTLILSGKCRLDDVTNANTVLSSQLADLTLIVTNEGQVKDSGTKGLIPRVLETLFAF